MLVITLNLELYDGYICINLFILITYPFQIRDHPLYHLIKAQAKKKQGELAEAIQTLQMAMSLSSVRRVGSSSKSKHKKMELSSADSVSVFLELAEALWLIGEQVKSRFLICKMSTAVQYSILFENL